MSIAVRLHELPQWRVLLDLEMNNGAVLLKPWTLRLLKMGVNNLLSQLLSGLCVRCYHWRLVSRRASKFVSVSVGVDLLTESLTLTF